MDPSNNTKKKELSQMSEVEKLKFLKDEFLPTLKNEMLKDLNKQRQQRLLIFESKWKNVRLPWGIERKSHKIVQPLLKSIHDMWWKAGLRMERSEWASLGEQMVAIVGPCMIRCYYLGYEMAAGNVRREEGNDFLLTAIEQIEDFVVQTTGIFVARGLINSDMGLNLVNNIVTQAINAGNEHIILGINNFHKVGRRVQ